MAEPDPERPSAEPIDLGGEISEFKRRIGMEVEMEAAEWQATLDEGDAEGRFDQWLYEAVRNKLGKYDWVEVVSKGRRMRLEADYVGYLDTAEVEIEGNPRQVKATYQLEQSIEGDKQLLRYRGVDIYAEWDFEREAHVRRTSPEKVHPEELIVLTGLIVRSRVYEAGMH